MFRERRDSTVGQLRPPTAPATLKRTLMTVEGRGLSVLREEPIDMGLNPLAVYVCVLCAIAMFATVPN